MGVGFQLQNLFGGSLDLFRVGGGLNLGRGFVDDHLSHTKLRVCMSKTFLGVAVALNKNLYVRANWIVGREQKSHYRAFYSGPWIGSAVHQQFERGDTGAMV